jgi:hypothetical protein
VMTDTPSATTIPGADVKTPPMLAHERGFDGLCGVAAKPTIQVGAMGHCGPRHPAAQSKTELSICCRSQIVANYRRWSHVVWTPSWLAVANADEDCRSSSPVSADFRSRFIEALSAGSRSSPWLSTKRLGLDRRDVKPIDAPSWRKAVDNSPLLRLAALR